MRILGIDPGLAIIGYGVLDKADNGQITVVDYGMITTPKEHSLPVRLTEIYGAMQAILAKFKPDQIAIEELFFNQNITTGIPVSHARGVTLLACKQFTDQLYEYTPLQIKQAITGVGRAEKHQVQYMTKTILNLSAIPRPDDVADAIAVALCHSQTNNMIIDNKIK